jgi:ribosomal protein L37AE/L43A
MADRIWCELVCDSCSIMVAGKATTGRTIPRRALAEEARSYRAERRNGLWYCADCLIKKPEVPFDD